MADRMSIIVFSGTVDKLMAASILATGGAAMGMEVEVFLTFWGLDAFRKDGYKTNTVKVYACSMTMELFDKKLEDLEPIVDDVTGVATFVERAKEGKITLFI